MTTINTLCEEVHTRDVKAEVTAIVEVKLQDLKDIGATIYIDEQGCEVLNLNTITKTK